MKMVSPAASPVGQNKVESKDNLALDSGLLALDSLPHLLSFRGRR